MTLIRARWRLATLLHQMWLSGQSTKSIRNEAESTLDYYRSELTLIADNDRYARQRGWQVASAELSDRYASRLVALQERVSALVEQLRAQKLPVSTAAHWFREIQQLESEFDSVDIDWDRNALVVNTESITLVDIELGTFAIEFHWDRLRRCSLDCFEIEALEPNSATENDEVTHPHVRDRSLCFGDASESVIQALTEGRLTDAFLLVRSVLQNYNASSPYVALEHWFGGSCHDCGRRYSSEEMYFCEGCDSEVCEDCFGCCASCQRSRCSNCLSPCALCEDESCSRCLVEIGANSRSCCPNCCAECVVCGRLFPTDELDEEQNTCPQCEQERDDGNSSVDITTNPDTSGEHHNEIDPSTAEARLCPAGVAEAAVLLSSR